MNSRQLYNMVEDLHLSDDKYLLCLTIFFLSYSLFEVRHFSLWGFIEF